MDVAKDTFEGTIHETAPMLTAPWGPLADRIARLIRHEQQLAQKLLLAPVRAFHAYAAFLQLSPLSDSLPELELQQLLLHSNPRDLICSVLPGGGSAFWRALSLAGSVGQAGDFYRRLDALTRGPCGWALNSGGPLTPQRLDFLDLVAGLDPLVASSPAAITNDRRLAVELDMALVFLREVDLLEDDRSVQRALRKVSYRKTREFLRRRLARATAPLPHVVGTKSLRPILNGQELCALGQKFNNCLASRPHYLIHLAAGTRMFFEWQGEQPAVVCIGVGPRGVHWLDQVCGPENGNVSTTLRCRIEMEFSSIDMPLVRGDLGESLRALLSRFDAFEDDDDDSEVALEESFLQTGEEIDGALEN